MENPSRTDFWHVDINSSNACCHMFLRDFKSKNSNTKITVNIENDFYNNCRVILYSQMWREPKKM